MGPLFKVLDPSSETNIYTPFLIIGIKTGNFFIRIVQMVRELFIEICQNPWEGAQ
jgi:hypothetical protein